MLNLEKDFKVSNSREPKLDSLSRLDQTKTISDSNSSVSRLFAQVTRRMNYSTDNGGNGKMTSKNITADPYKNIDVVKYLF